MVTSQLVDGAVSNDGHGGVPSNREQDNNSQERQSSTNRSPRAVRVIGRKRRRGLVLASGQVRPANARNLINPTPVASANAQAGVRIVAGPVNIGGAPRAVHAPGVVNVGGVVIVPAPFGVGGNPPVHAGIANAAGAGAIGPLVGVQVGGIAPAGQAPAQPNFDIEAGLSGLPLRRSEVGPLF